MRGLKVVLVLILALSGPRRAQAESPDPLRLTLTGAALSIPTYALVLMSHEGSHALAAKALGAEITGMSLIPGRHPTTGKFFFAYVDVRGLKTSSRRALFYAAPKITGGLILGGLAALEAGGGMPRGSYSHLSLLVLATGYWVDFSRDIIATWDHNDTVKLYKLMGFDSEWSRFPLRFAHLTLSAASGYILIRGFQNLLNRADQERPDDAVMFSLISTSF